MLATAPDLELHACVVSLHDRSVVGLAGSRLSTLESRLLAYLASRPGESITRDELLRHVWGYASSRSYRAVDVAMHRLRSKVEATPAEPRNLVTVQGEGYAFMPTNRSPAAPLGPVADSRLLAPQSRAAFIGRVSELAALVASFEQHRVVLLSGPPGVGKSRLAHEYSGHFPPERVAWVDLCNARSISQLLTLFGRGEGAGASLAVDEEGHVAAAGARLLLQEVALLVLDNADALRSELEPVVAQWTAQIPTLRVVITCRADLALESASRLGVRPLPTKDAVALLLDRLPQTPSRRTFVDATSEQLEELVTALDALPLAIELAAARAATMTMADVVLRLDQRFRLLRDPVGLSPDLGLGGAITWSIRQISVDGRQVLSSLSVFRGPFGLQDAEAVVQTPAAGSWIPDLLAELVAASLVEQVEPNARGQTQYRLLRTIRDLASAHHGKRDADLRRRHASHFASIRNSLRVFAGGEVPIGTLRELDRIGNDLAHAFEWSLAHVPAQAAELALALDAWWNIRGSAQTRERLADRVIGVLPPRTLDRVRAQIVFCRARARMAIGRTTEANADLDAALALADVPTSLSAMIRAERAIACEFESDNDRAVDELRIAGDEARAADDLDLGAHIDAMCTAVCRSIGRDTIAGESLNDVLTRSVEQLTSSDRRHYTLGVMVLQMRNMTYEGAWTTVAPMRPRARAIALEEELPFQVSHIEALAALAHEVELDWDEAASAWRRCVNLLLQLGHRSVAANVRARRAWGLQHAGAHDEARAESLAALRMMTGNPSPLLRYNAHVTLTMIALEEAHPSLAVRLSAAALDAVAGTLEDRVPHARALHALALLKNGDHARAIEEQTAARAGARAHNHPVSGLVVALTSVLVAAELGQPSLAEGSLERLKAFAPRLLNTRTAEALLSAYRGVLERLPRGDVREMSASLAWFRWLSEPEA